MTKTETFVPHWSIGKHRLDCLDDGTTVGFLDLGLGKVDSDPPVVLIDMTRVSDNRAYRRGRVSNWLIDVVVATWPGCSLRGGPLSDDEPDGPAFRKRTWDRGIAFHDGGCELFPRGYEPPPKECACYERLRVEAERLKAERASTSIDANSSQES